MAGERAEVLQERSKAAAIRVVKVSAALPRTREAEVVAKQLTRSGTSMAANYRAACRARSRAEFISKMSVVVEETDETLFWLEVVRELDWLSPTRLDGLAEEISQLLAIFARSRATARRNGSGINKAGNREIKP